MEEDLNRWHLDLVEWALADSEEWEVPEVSKAAVAVEVSLMGSKGHFHQGRLQA